MDVVKIKGDPMKVQMDAVANSLIPGFRVKKKFSAPKSPTVVLPPEGWTSYQSTKADVKNKKKYDTMIHDELIDAMPTRAPLKIPKKRKPSNNKMAKKKFAIKGKTKKKKVPEFGDELAGDELDQPKSGDFDGPDDGPKSGDDDGPDDGPKSGDFDMEKILDYLPSR